MNISAITAVDNRVEFQPASVAQHTSQIGQILLRAGKLTADDVNRVLQFQRNNASLFGEAALNMKLIKIEDLQSALAVQFSFPYVSSSSNTTLSPKLIAAYKPYSADVERMRNLRNTLTNLWFKGDDKCLLLASARSGEGRSFCIANLAVTFAQLGRKTLLVDADLRNPSLHQFFAADVSRGLSQILAKRSSVSSCLSATAMEYLTLLPAGPHAPNPQELMGGAQFSSVITEVKQKFDVILFDSPAARLLTDADIMASAVGGAIVLTRRGVTRVAEAATVAERLSNAGSRVLGSMINAY
jgi:protein-tyrosine kinase